MAYHDVGGLKKQEKVDKTRRTTALDSQPISQNLMAPDITSYLIGETSFNPLIQNHAELLSKSSSEQRAIIARQLQTTYGNGYVQRLIKSMAIETKLTVSTPDDPYEQEADRVAEAVTLAPEPHVHKIPQKHSIQRSPTDPSPEVPALLTSTVEQVNSALQRGTTESRQQAVNLIVSALIEAGVIDAQRIENRQMRYEPGFSPSGGDYGLTSLTPGRDRPRPSRVRIGDRGVTSARTLYSTIIHEYQHVNQFWDNSGVSEDIDEIQAYLYEIEQMQASGLNQDLAQMSFLRRQLMAYWDRASSNTELRAPYQQRYDRALQAIEDRMCQIQTGGGTSAQRQVMKKGNIQTKQFASLMTVQGKLTVSTLKDPYELEADRVADAVTRAPSSQVQEQSEEEEIQAKHISSIQWQAPEEEGELQKKGTAESVPEFTDDLESHIKSAQGGGISLPENVRNSLEPQFGQDFGDVRIHADSEANELSRELNARAFTTGSDIFFSAGSYQPDSQDGKRLLAHELTHVVQQTAGTLARAPAKSKGTVSIGQPTVTYYDVEGDNLQEVGNALGTDEWGSCNWDFSGTSYESTEGVVDVVNVKLSLTINLPRWTGDGWKKASPAAKKEWNRMIKALKTHENGHSSRAKKFAPELKKKLLGKAEGDYQTTIDEAIASHKTDVQDAYDSETSSGQTQGVSLDPNIDGSAN